MKTRFVSIFALSLQLVFGLAAFGQGYDEVFDLNGVRPHYQKYWRIYEDFSAGKKEELLKKSVKDFRGDNSLLPLPRVITSADEDFLSRGVDQRARALQAFLVDHYTGRKRYLKTGAIPKSVVNGALKRNGELTRVKPNGKLGFNFWYGPDIIRDKDGVFRVVEDNTGFIGGMGDLIKARQSLASSVPEFKPLMKDTSNPADFYKQIAKRYQQIAKENHGIPLMINYPRSRRPDNEDQRTIEIFRKNGIESFIAQPLNVPANKEFLRITPNGLYLKRRLPDGTIESQKVGHVILNYEAGDFDHLDPSVYHKYLDWQVDYEDMKVDPARLSKLRAEPRNYRDIEEWLQKDFPGELTPSGYEGFWDLVRRGKVSVTNPTGLEFINDKGFYPYVENLIRTYLHEEPILRNIETTPAANFHTDGSFTLNRDIIEAAKANPEAYVEKGVVGRGGDAVFIGKKMSREENLKVLRDIEANPDRFIFQKYTPLSQMDGYIVDIRVLSDVSNHGVITARVPWGRGLPINGSGKVNISGEGRETAIVVENASCGMQALEKAF